MSDMTKEQREHMRKLAATCYEKEMAHALDTLYEEFKRWENDEIGTWDLNDKIHQHYNGTARDLWKTFEQLNDPRVALSQAIIKGIIKLDDVHENCRPMLQGLIDAYRNDA